MTRAISLVLTKAHDEGTRHNNRTRVRSWHPQVRGTTMSSDDRHYRRSTEPIIACERHWMPPSLVHVMFELVLSPNDRAEGRVEHRLGLAWAWAWAWAWE